ncbi:DUF2188 domain-containing protein [Alteromonas macleodii]|uniref:DUF2188 domain-containing protein n=1 Tax=Alteromonas macleodii TaxID=28108 RepID=A0A6T9Y514_ALTMA|nr:conserved protein of unknown function [Alteromonas macleodii]
MPLKQLYIYVLSKRHSSFCLGFRLRNEQIVAYAAKIIKSQYLCRFQLLNKSVFPRGGWDVKKVVLSEPKKQHDTQAEALQWTKDVAKNQKSELYVHGKDGKFREKIAMGTNPILRKVNERLQ